MKVLFFITNYPNFGGIETVTTVLSNWLSSKGVDCSILSFRNRAPELGEQLSKNVRISFIPDGEGKFETERNKKYVSDFLTNEDFDVIVYQDCYSTIHKCMTDVLPNIRAKLIVVEHNTPICSLIGYKQYWKNLKWSNFHDFCRKIIYPITTHRIRKHVIKRHNDLLELSDSYVLLSNNFVPQINWLCGHHFDMKFTIIGNPVTLPTLRYSECRYSKKKQILWIGRMTQDKGCRFIPEIWSRIEPRFPGWKLVIVGDGPEYSIVRKRFDALNLKNVVFEGFQRDVSNYYKESVILMMTSVFEGWGLVLVEAMSRGCVPMAFNSFASLTDIIDNKTNGIVVKPYSVDEYAESLMCLLNNEDLLCSMSYNAYQKAKCFEIDGVGNKWLKLFDSLIKGTN